LHVAVTGGAGFIGSHLVAELGRREYSVLVVDDFSRPATPRHVLEESGFEVVEVDILDTERLAAALRGVDALVHLAALVDVRESEEEPLRYARVNVLGTVSALEAARRAGVGRVVYASSAAVYGEPLELPLREEHPLRPLSFYGSTKAMGEEACRYYSGRGLSCTALRFFNVYGELGRKNVVYIFLKRLLRGEPLIVYGDGGQTRDFIYVGDVASAVAAALEAGGEGYAVYNVGSGREVSVNELIRVIAGVTGVEPRVAYRPARRGEIRRSYASVERLRGLGWEPHTTLEEGVERVYRWIAGGEPPVL